MSIASIPATMSEAQFQQRIIDYCQLRGLLVFHDHDSRRNQAGFPDLVIVGRHGVIFAELKTDKGKLRPDQEKWLLCLHAAGCIAVVWRPSMWDKVCTRLDAIR
jgi:hypothetical protein